MRIIGGAWRGRRLSAPPGAGTRPTSHRVRQALFDMLLHAAWAGREAVEGAAVLDAFAGTGALGLEALSRGAASATFLERDRAALAALRANVAACAAGARARVLEFDALRPRPGVRSTLAFSTRPTVKASCRGRSLRSLRRGGSRRARCWSRSGVPRAVALRGAASRPHPRGSADRGRAPWIIEPSHCGGNGWVEAGKPSTRDYPCRASASRCSPPPH